MKARLSRWRIHDNVVCLCLTDRKYRQIVIKPFRMILPSSLGKSTHLKEILREEFLAYSSSS